MVSFVFFCFHLKLQQKAAWVAHWYGLLTVHGRENSTRIPASTHLNRQLISMFSHTIGRSEKSEFFFFFSVSDSEPLENVDVQPWNNDLIQWYICHGNVNYYHYFHCWMRHSKQKAIMIEWQLSTVGTMRPDNSRWSGASRKIRWVFCTVLFNNSLIICAVWQRRTICVFWHFWLIKCNDVNLWRQIRVINVLRL